MKDNSTSKWDQITVSDYELNKVLRRSRAIIAKTAQDLSDPNLRHSDWWVEERIIKPLVNQWKELDKFISGLD